MKESVRKLIKFSNYSLCITLPKKILSSLDWNKGDTMHLKIDSKKGSIVITKGEPVKKIAKTEIKKEVNEKKKSRW